MRCRSCGLRQTWPRPDPDALAARYDEHDYYDDRCIADATGAWRERARGLLDVLGPGPAVVLDIGAGDGGLVHGLREEGVEADGFEPSSAGRRRALDRGVTLLPALPDPEPRYTAVTLLHVLEHVDDPVALLRSLRPLLHPGGKLVVEVPNVASLDAKVPGHRALILDLPFHLHHFTLQTLLDVLARAGWEPVAVDRYNNRALEWLLTRRAPSAEGRGAAPTGSPGPEEPARRRGPARRAWHDALGLLRRVVPGTRLRVVATVAGSLDSPR